MNARPAPRLGGLVLGPFLSDLPAPVAARPTCSTCQYLTPAVPARPGVWEQRSGAMRFTQPQPAHDAYCGHQDDEVVSVQCSEYDGDDALLVVHQPDRFSCSRWAPRP